jgi:hypothetical protein
MIRARPSKAARRVIPVGELSENPGGHTPAAS